MRSKSLLFAGIILLLVGILFRKMTQADILGLSLIIIGVTCKSIYIIKKIINGEYKPGKEVIALVLGLLLFFTGLYFRGLEQQPIKPIYLIILGITLKIVFVVRFIQITRSSSKDN